ncbi:hypothetical protein ABIB27_003831 [Arthrobacter sp. UYEF21]
MVLRGDEAGPAVQLLLVQRFAELPGGHRGCADIADLAGFDDVVKGFQGLLDRRGGIPPVDLVQIHVVGCQSGQAGIKFREDGLA